jgi:signal transduction histidine kinase
MADLQQLLDEAYKVRVQNLPRAISLANEALEQGKKNSDLSIVAWAQTLLGLFYMIRNEFEESVRISTEAIQFFTAHNDVKGLAHARYNIGSVYYKSNHFHEGLDYLLQCLTAFREINDQHNVARVLKSVGTIYEFFGDEENALLSYEGSIEAARKVSDLNAESNAYNPLSGIYLKRGDHKHARQLAEESIRIKKETGDTRGLAFSIYALAKVEQRESSFERALPLYKQSLGINEEMGDHLGEGMALNKIGLLYYEHNFLTESKVYLNKALQLAEQLNIQVILFKANFNLYQVYKKEGDVPQSLNYLEKFLEAKNSVINSHTLSVIRSYQVTRKIQLLENQAAIQKGKAEVIEKKNAELDSFFYRVSHDLKGPISSLLGLHNLVKMEVKDEISRTYFDLYDSQVRRINKIVMDLIDLTQMTNRTITLVPIDFKELLDECIQSYSYLENFKKVKFIIGVSPAIDYKAEWAIVNTVLQNLIENSIKYARTNVESYLKLMVAQQEDVIVINVEDNGQGIHPDHQSKIFDMFYRASDNVKGSGLGLYILKRAIERLSGQITFESELGKGTRFIITLPLKRTLAVSHS